MWKRALSIFLLLSITIGLVACGGRQSQQIDSTTVQMELSAADMTVGRTELSIKVTYGEGNPVNDAVLEIKGDMSHAGMVPVLAEADSGQDGVYTVPFEWTMGGDWFVTVNATFEDGTTISKRFDGLSIGGDMGDMDHGDHGDGEDEEVDHSGHGHGEGEEMDHGDHENEDGDHNDH